MDTFTPSLAAEATAVLPACWIVARLTVARYGHESLTHVTHWASEAERQGQDDIATLWSDVAQYIRAVVR